MTEDRLVSLIARRVFGELAPEENLELETWANETQANRQFLDRSFDQGLLNVEIAKLNGIDPYKGYEQWVKINRGKIRAGYWRVGEWSIAAAFLCTVLVMGLYTQKYKTEDHISARPVVGIATKPIEPGRNTAVLTLANGRKVLLDSAIDGKLAIQGSAQVVKNGTGSLAYLSTKDSKVETIFNTLTTPKSGQYQLVLQDGSHVWLNNVSSLRYPTIFSGRDRTVELSGEAYFEIAKDVDRPFVVKVGNATVKVLGTSFNIMAYPDEGGTETTLLTGAVQVRDAGAAVQLKPDEQAQAGPKGISVIKGVPSQDIISWKNGFFYFGRASFDDMMRQLARWYDVDVVYKGKVPQMEFVGKIDRSLTLNDLLKFLDKNQIHFRVEGRKLIVLPN